MTKGKQRDVNLAYEVLKQTGHSMYFRDLITKVLALKGMPIHSLAHAMAEIHTKINMDSRFYYGGKGMWSLSEWIPARGHKHAEETAATLSDAKLEQEAALDVFEDEPAE